MAALEKPISDAEINAEINASRQEIYSAIQNIIDNTASDTLNIRDIQKFDTLIGSNTASELSKLTEYGGRISQPNAVGYIDGIYEKALAGFSGLDFFIKDAKTKLGVSGGGYKRRKFMQRGGGRMWDAITALAGRGGNWLKTKYNDSIEAIAQRIETASGGDITRAVSILSALSTVVIGANTPDFVIDAAKNFITSMPDMVWTAAAKTVGGIETTVVVGGVGAGILTTGFIVAVFVAVLMAVGKFVWDGNANYATNLKNVYIDILIKLGIKVRTEGNQVVVDEVPRRGGGTETVNITAAVTVRGPMDRFVRRSPRHSSVPPSTTASSSNASSGVGGPGVVGTGVGTGSSNAVGGPREDDEMDGHNNGAAGGQGGQGGGRRRRSHKSRRHRRRSAGRKAQRKSRRNSRK
jgi:hypothetical protein